MKQNVWRNLMRIDLLIFSFDLPPLQGPVSLVVVQFIFDCQSKSIIGWSYDQILLASKMVKIRIKNLNDHRALHHEYCK